MMKSNLRCLRGEVNEFATRGDCHAVGGLLRAPKRWVFLGSVYLQWPAKEAGIGQDQPAIINVDLASEVAAHRLVSLLALAGLKTRVTRSRGRAEVPSVSPPRSR
jgi:hypothetical protein